MSKASIDDLLTFWFDQAGPEKWYTRDDAFDQEITSSFEPLSCALVEEIGQSGKASWEQTAEGALAVVIALDQFPRNMYRDDPRSFGWDGLALGVASRAIEAGFDMALPTEKRMFFYLPFMHSEDLADQDFCVSSTEEKIGNEANIHHAHEHRELIRRFGRFPHRNEVLGRECTEEEKKFLEEGGYSP